MIKEILVTEKGEQAVMAIDELLSEASKNEQVPLTEQELNFYLIEVLEKEINSGGFNRYFYYEYGNFVLETIKALQEIGSTYFLRILQEAVQVFGESYPNDENERSNIKYY